MHYNTLLKLRIVQTNYGEANLEFVALLDLLIPNHPPSASDQRYASPFTPFSGYNTLFEDPNSQNKLFSFHSILLAFNIVDYPLTSVPGVVWDIYNKNDSQTWADRERGTAEYAPTIATKKRWVTPQAEEISAHKICSGRNRDLALNPGIVFR